MKEVVAFTIVDKQFTCLRTQLSDIIWPQGFCPLRKVPAEKFSKEFIVRIVEHHCQGTKQAMQKKVTIVWKIHPHFIEGIVQRCRNGFGSVGTNLARIQTLSYKPEIERVSRAFTVLC